MISGKTSIETVNETTNNTTFWFVKFTFWTKFLKKTKNLENLWKMWTISLGKWSVYRSKGSRDTRYSSGKKLNLF